MALSQATSIEQAPPDFTNVLELAETRELVEDFFYDFCGLAVYKEGSITKLKRVNKPTISYEFAREIISRYYIPINRITGRSTLTPEYIVKYNIQAYDSMAEWLAITGFKHLISDSVWSKIQDLNKVPELKPMRKDPISGIDMRNNQWYEKYKVIWDYNAPVYFDMVELVKKEYGLDKESFGQDVILRAILGHMQSFYHISLNRSENALTLQHEKVTHKETFAHTQDAVASESENAYEKAKKFVRGMMPSG